MTARLTLAIPFHRGIDYLREAIESVRAQSSPEWALVVCDDGRVEAGAREAVESSRDDRITYLGSDDHGGMVANWNRCLERAATPLVTLLHADDRLLPGYVDLMLELSQRHPEAVAYYCGAQIIDARGRRRFSTADATKRLFAPAARGDVVLRGEPAVRALMAGNFIMCPTLCFHRSHLGDRRFDSRWQQVQDLELTTRLLMDGEALVGSPRTAYAYRRHSASATTRQSESFLRFDEERALFQAVAQRAESLGWREAARVSRRMRIIKLHLLYRMADDLVHVDLGAAGTKLRYLLGMRAGLGQ